MSTPLTTIKKWFLSGSKPEQSQFWAWMDSYWHKDEVIPIGNIDGLQQALNDAANAGNPPIENTINSSGTFDIPAGKLLETIVLIPTTDQNISIGDSSASGEYLENELVTAVNGLSLYVGVYAVNQKTIHITANSTNVKFYLK